MITHSNDVQRLQELAHFQKQGVDTYISEVDESITNAIAVSYHARGNTKFTILLALVREVNAEIHEIVSSPARLVNNLFQCLLIKLVWYVSKHDLEMLVSRHLVRKSILTVVRTSMPCLIRPIST